MRKTFTFWAVFAALGVQLWLASLGIGGHPVYRMTLMIAMLSWAGWFAGAATIRASRQQ
jgi:hypothetical protein